MSPTAKNMQFWREEKQTNRESKAASTPFQEFAGQSEKRKGQKQKLSLEQENSYWS